MPRSKPAARTWGEYVRARTDALHMSQADLRRRMEDLGEPISRQTVSQWFNGVNAPEPDTVPIAAVALGDESPDTAMRAAGFERIADAIAGRPLRIAGEPPEPVDDAIRAILANPHLSADEKADAVAHYKRRKARLLAEINALVDAMVNPDNDTDEPGTAAV
jgi:transcriptional regulator with XRE-family HTH domain